MSYQRKLEDKKRFKKLVSSWWPSGAYVKERPNHSAYLKRYWKSEGKYCSWAWHKKQARKMCRRYLKKYNLYTKKAYDLWWNVW